MATGLGMVSSVQGEVLFQEVKVKEWKKKQAGVLNHGLTLGVKSERKMLEQITEMRRDEEGRSDVVERNILDYKVFVKLESC